MRRVNDATASQWAVLHRSHRQPTFPHQICIGRPATDATGAPCRSSPKSRKNAWTRSNKGAKSPKINLTQKVVLLEPAASKPKFLPLEDTVAKKKALTAVQINRLLKFKLDWIKDPVPPFRRHLDAATRRQIAQAKVAFGKEIDQIVKNRPAGR
jgi:hypothetical protein